MWVWEWELTVRHLVLAAAGRAGEGFDVCSMRVCFGYESVVCLARECSLMKWEVMPFVLPRSSVETLVESFEGGLRAQKCA